MKNLKKLTILSLASLVLAGCGGNNPSSVTPSSAEPSSAAPSSAEPSSQGRSEYPVPSVTPIEKEKPTTYVALDEDEVFEEALAGYDELVAAAHNAASTNESYVRYAKAEALLLDSGVAAISTTNGGTYGITRVAVHSVPYVFWGNDSDRLEGTVIIKAGGENNFITKEHRAALLEAWQEAREGGDDYDPQGMLEEWGYEIADSYTVTFNETPATLDMLATSRQNDTEIICQGLEGLYKYDNLGNRQPALAVGEPEISEDGKVYTFTIRDDAWWVTSDNQKFAKVCADDFVAGFQHMLDAAGGLEYLTEGIVGVSDYLYNGGSFDDVGVKVVDDKLQITLVAPEAYFLTRLNYSCFMPMNREFFLSRGGAFGRAEYEAASGSDDYRYGLTSDVSSILYNSAYVAKFISDLNLMTYEANPDYYNAENVTTKHLRWIYDDGKNPDAVYASAVAGNYISCGLGAASGILAKAKADGNFDKYHFISDTDATTFFGGYNLDRQTFEYGTAVSDKNEQEKIDFRYAIQNANFRRAIQHAWDRITWNAISVGEDVAAFSIRNTYTPPEFVALNADITVDGHTFTQGMSYGKLVEYFLEEDFGRVLNLDDGQDGWYDPYLARYYLNIAKAEMGDNWAPVKLELISYSGSAAMTARAKAYEKSIEDVLGVENVDVVLLEAENTRDYYYSGYYASTGKDCNYDLFYGSGWGPDYGDPSTYLDTFVSFSGYMTKVIGLY